ncbi:hypothetical protein OBBRIDRAFT_171326 [Obba rivulosa]|uniref:Uncharacterized protein n=1 Tax=Obba rivulosa TaxID=1052685 RepID=A0A8E2ASM6_9APHY|nr:hypothetical protein OBBRIDRAFT_171326 [Obba rivulosa]
MDVPSIRLSDGSYELSWLFWALFDDLNFFDPGRELTVSDTSAVIRLSHKYGLDKLLHQALRSIEEPLTSEPSDWSSINDHLRRSMAPIFPSDGPILASLGHLTGRASLLPMAYYLCCQLGVHELVYGVKEMGGSVSCPKPTLLDVYVDSES